MGCWTHGPVVACLLACWQSGRVLRSYVAVHIFTMCITKYDRHATDWLTPCFWRWKMLGFFMEGILLQCLDVEYYLMSNLWCFASDSFLNVSPKSWERHMGPRASNWRMIWNVISVLLVVMMQPRLNLDLSVHPKYSFRNLAQKIRLGEKKTNHIWSDQKKKLPETSESCQKGCHQGIWCLFHRRSFRPEFQCLNAWRWSGGCEQPSGAGDWPKALTLFHHFPTCSFTLKHWLLPW